MGFDTGPGMALIDEACRLYFGERMDKDGIHAKLGKVRDEVLMELSTHKFVQKSPPKSTGRHEFGKGLAERIISNRADVTREMDQIVKTRLKEKQIIVTDLSITNFEFTADFLKSVEDKQIAEQMAKKAEKDVERVKKEALQVVERAKAEAQSLKLQREAVSDQLIELRKVEAQIKAIDKWNGVLSQYSGGGAVPFINVK